MEQSVAITGRKSSAGRLNPAHKTRTLHHRTRTLFKLFCAGLILSASSTFAQPQPESSGKNPSTVLMDILLKKARSLSEQNYQATEHHVPEILTGLNYDQYRSIRFKPKQALWRDEGLFELQLLHPGFLFKEGVELQTVDQQGITSRVPFDSGFFTYGDNATAQLVDKAQPSYGYSGFRVHFPLNSSQYKDEIAVFQGASYFRLVGPGQVYGLSARGLAVDTAEASGEEFPRFTDFWLLQPAADSDRMEILALLDSPSITGVYRFVLSASSTTSAEVDVVLFPRKDINKVGIAPLTSMFFFGEAGLRHHDDFRHEVHDSDGLLMQTSRDQWIWRPLTNPKTLQVTSLLDINPRGFGLVQRDRDFSHYQDLEANYQNRPSLWVQPKGDWGNGRVELVEIPTDNETNDNIVAYWVPKEPFRAGQERRFSYNLSTFNARLEQPTPGEVSGTRIGWGAVPGQANPPPHSTRLFAIVFAGDTLNQLPSDTPVKAKLETSSGKLSEPIVTKLPGEHGWRVTFRLKPEADTPADMRLHLHLRDTQLTEVWSYVWNPNNIDQ